MAFCNSEISEVPVSPSLDGEGGGGGKVVTCSMAYRYIVSEFPRDTISIEEKREDGVGLQKQKEKLRKGHCRPCVELINSMLFEE